MNMSFLSEEIKSWASKKTLAAHESLYLLGSCADNNEQPSDLDILWISERPMPELWQKELYVLSGLMLDMCTAPVSEIISASTFSHHPLSFLALALKHQASFLHGKDIRKDLLDMDIQFIKEVRSLQALREWMNYLEFKKIKHLRKVILGLAVTKEIIPVESGISKKSMEESFSNVSGELQDFYQVSVLDQDAEDNLQKQIQTFCYPDFIKGRDVSTSWQTWDPKGRLFSLIEVEGQTIKRIRPFLLGKC